MKKQNPPPQQQQQENKPVSNTKISSNIGQTNNNANKRITTPSKPLEQQQQQQQNGQNNNPLQQIVRRQSIIRRLSQRKKTNIQEEQNKPNWKCLSTGLEMLFSTEQIHKIWSFDKPKMIISELLHDLLKKLDAQKNFESMELNIIAEFHLYNLIFAKQKLFLDNEKAAIFLNLMWTLLINDNPDYKMLHLNYTRATLQTLNEMNKKTETIQSMSQIPVAQAAAVQSSVSQKKVSSLSNITESLKSITRDLDNFKKWIIKHSFHNPPGSLKIFDAQQVQMIVEFAQNSYFSNFSLYNYCLNNKKKNEEIHIQLFIDKPLVIPPLSDALYMGQPKIEIPDDEDDDLAAKNRTKQKKESFVQKSKVPSIQQFDKMGIGKESMDSNSHGRVESDLHKLNLDGQHEEGGESHFEQQEEQDEDEYDNEDNLGLQKYSSQSKRSQNHNHAEEQEIKNIVNAKLKTIEEQFSQTLQKRQEEINKQFDDIVNPKKKK